MQLAALIDSRNAPANQVVAIIGGGGKSTLMDKLSRELIERNLRVVLTSTTKFQVSSRIATVLQTESRDYLSEVESWLQTSKLAAVAKDSYQEKNRLLGVSQQTVSELRTKSDIVLVEADGARQRPLKTHKEYEPVIPGDCTSVIIICGAEAVGQPLSDKWVHRAELFARKWDLKMGTTLTPEIIARELISPYSYLKNIPIHAHIAIFINKSDKNAIGGRLLAENLRRKCEYPVFLGSLKKNQLQSITLNSKKS
ncbi:MAG: selenium cofactor biosynthesis protein YqeC [bacterium]